MTRAAVVAPQMIESCIKETKKVLGWWEVASSSYELTNDASNTHTCVCVYGKVLVSRDCFAMKCFAQLLLVATTAN